jgi:hypothetical protein
MSDDKAKKEWDRVMSNPDNLIISDSLIERVDPYNLGEIENPVQVKTICTFEFSEHTLSGEVLGFSNVEGQRTYTFASHVKDASKLMHSSDLKQFSMHVGTDELISMGNEHIKELNFNVDVQSASQALVTISFIEVAE